MRENASFYVLFCYYRKTLTGEVLVNGIDLISYLVSPVSVVGLIVGLAEIAKILNVDPKLIPLVDLILGLFFGVCLYGLFFGYGIIQGGLIGIDLGLSACGLFSGFKNLSSLK